MNSLKFLTLSLFSLSIMLLTACGGGGSELTNSDKSNTAQEKIETYALNGIIPPTVQDYIEAGITGVNSNNIDSINKIVENLVTEDVDTREEVQALADQLGISNSCSSNQHKENEKCVNNTKTVDCSVNNIPTNAAEIITQIQITWTNSSWTSAAHCEWSCNSGYQKNENICEISTSNNAPIAKAGDDQTAIVGSNISLASSSVDDDGTIISSEWKEGTTILSNLAAFSKDDFAIGNHSITLTVTDNDGSVNTDTVIITITPSPNNTPTANAGENQTVALGTNITLDAGSSSDSDGTIIAWEWKEDATILSTNKAFSKSNFTVGTHTITLTVTDSGGATDSDAVTVLITTDSHAVINQTEAAKFLTRSTFGPTKNNIITLLNKGTYESWLSEQFSVPATFHLPRVDTLATKMCANIDDDGDPMTDSWEIRYARHQVWWEAAVNAEDQLRQRIAFALSEIMVVSDSDGLGLSELQRGVTGYYDLFVQHAFGNFRDLLEDVTIHPAMGDFLSLTRNQKENSEEGIRPDENYAREVLQLFTIGVHELNIDGTEKLDANLQPIPTYDQKTIEEFAKVFTGWGYSDIEWDGWFSDSDHTLPLKAYEEYHDTSEKTLLNGAVSPANKTAQVDLNFALDNIFNHPNVAPFISAQLIQRLVTSNPTPAYVGRVANIFNNNGNGIKGDLKAVVKAILLDEEALNTIKSASFGKLKEPLLRISHLWRNFPIQAVTREGHYWEEDDTCGQGTYQYYEFWGSLDSFVNKAGQGPLQARSVFNFFRPDHTPNGMLNDLGLKAPEFQIINENTLVGFTNLTYYMVTEFSFADGITDEVYTVSDDLSKLDLNQVTTLAINSGNLLDYLSLVLLNDQMTSALRAILLEHLEQENIFPERVNGQFVRAHEAIILIINSPEYLIQQ